MLVNLYSELCEELGNMGNSYHLTFLNKMQRLLSALHPGDGRQKMEHDVLGSSFIQN